MEPGERLATDAHGWTRMNLEIRVHVCSSVAELQLFRNS